MDASAPAAALNGASNGAGATPEQAGISAGRNINREVNSDLTLKIDEIALYDRQIRLWGVQAQEKWVISSIHPASRCE